MTATISTASGLSSRYPVTEPGSSDYVATGELGPVQHVSAGRMLRASPYGSLWVSEADPYRSDIIARPLLESVAFQLTPFERNVTAPDIQANGEHGSVLVPRFNRYGERSDYELWNVAAASLHSASDALTLRYSRNPGHYIRGAWQVSYVGTSGRDTVWADAERISAGLIRVSTQHPAHFVAAHSGGCVYRLRVGYQRIPDSPYWERYGLKVSPYLVKGEHRNIPAHVMRWIESRCVMA